MSGLSTALLFAFPALLAAGTSFVLTPLFGRFAVAVGAMDRPGTRKVHRTPVPRLGGLAVVLSVFAVLASGCLEVFGKGPRLPRELCIGLGFGVIPVLLVSIWDDVRPVRALPKLVAHITGALVAVAAGVSLSPTIHLFGRAIPIGIWALPLSVLWIVGLTNAFNIVDGLDGLSAGLAFISAGSLAGVFLLARQTPMAAASLVLAGGLLGFLPFNIYPAKVFLGDSGATFVGFLLAGFALKGGSTLSAGFATLLPLIILGLPVAETFVSVARRVVRRLEGGSAGVMEADRNHFHHRLLALGLDQRRAVYLLYAVGVVLALAGLLSVLITAKEAGLLLVALLLAGFVGVARLGYDEFAVVRSGFVLRFYENPVLKRSLFVVFFDLAMTGFAVYGAFGLKYDDWALAFHRESAFSLFAAFAPLLIVVFWAFGMYRGSWRLANVDDFVRVSQSTLVATGSVFLFDRVVSESPKAGSVFAIAGLLALMMANGARVSYRVLISRRWRATNRGIPTLIYGAGLGGAASLRELTSNQKAGLRPVGFIDDDLDKVGRDVNGLPIVGTVAMLDSAIERLGIGAVVVSSRKVSAQNAALATEICSERKVKLLRMEIRFEPSTPESNDRRT